MEELHVYSPEDVILSNLHELSDRLDILGEQELAHIRELAVELVNERDWSELLHALPDHRPPLLTPNDQTSPAARQALTWFHRTIQPQKCVLLCSEICRLLLQKRELPIGFFFPDTEEIAHDAVHRIIYQRSSYTDAAYLKLSSLIADPRAAYAHSFLSACEEVYNGFSEYCILPVENSSEGLLVSFSELIERYDLKIAASCDVESGGRTTRFALLRRNLLPLLTDSTASTYFECAIPLGGSPEVADVLTAAQICGLRLYRIDSLPRSLPDARFSAHLSFLTDHGDLRTFLLYLSMDTPQYTPIGLYPHFTKKGK